VRGVRSSRRKDPGTSAGSRPARPPPTSPLDHPNAYTMQHTTDAPTEAVPPSPSRGRGRLAVVLIAVAGCSVALNGLAPTGHAVMDALIVSVISALWIAGASAAPISVLATAAIVATALTGDVWTIAIGVAAIALAIGLRPAIGGPSSPGLVLRGPAIALCLAHLLARIRPLGAFGVSTLVACVIAVVVLVLGWRRHTPERRRVLRRATLALSALAGVGTLCFGITAADAASDLIDGGRSARAALRLADAGEIDAALAAFDTAATRLARADAALGAWWGVPGRAVPWLAQQQQVVRQLTADAARASTEITDILERTDYDALGVVEGRIDIDAVRSLEAPIDELDAALEGLESDIDGLATDWVAPPITDLLGELIDDVSSKRGQLVDLRAAIEQAPAMLGADGPRRYFIALTTPAEARGVGGLMGNWAEITIDDGRLELTGFGRHQDLLAAAPTTPRLTTMSPEYLAQYGPYVLGDDKTLSVGAGVWPNLTVPAHFPWVAETIAALYPQSGGGELDGVFLMDVYTIATLMRLTGPVNVENLGVEVNPENALQYLLRDQYLVTELDDRVDLLETLARTTIDRILAGALPPPPQLAALLRPLVQQHRLAAWAQRPAEQEVLRNANMTKELAAEPGAHVFAYTLYNGNGNKIDPYLEAEAQYVISTDSETGEVSVTFNLRLRNTAPTSGLPDYVIGNLVNLPKGTNRMLVSVLSTSQVRLMETEQAGVSWVTGSERGLATATTTVEVPAGGEVTLRVTFAPSTADELRRLVLDLPPTANPIPLTLEIDGSAHAGGPFALPGRFVVER